MVFFGLAVVCLVTSVIGYMTAEPNLKTWKPPVWPRVLLIVGTMLMGLAAIFRE